VPPSYCIGLRQTRMKRPLSITIIAWLLIITSPLKIFLTYYAYYVHSGPLFPYEQQAISISTLSTAQYVAHVIIIRGILFLCGISFLTRQNWSRYLYIITLVIHEIISQMTTKEQFLAGKSIYYNLGSAVILLILIYFLFSKKASSYFSMPSANSSG
jgi:hypothetical protein